MKKFRDLIRREKYGLPLSESDCRPRGHCECGWNRLSVARVSIICNRLGLWRSRQETVWNLRNLDLEKNAKDRLKGQRNKCVCSWKSEGRKKHAEYSLALKTQMAGVGPTCWEMKSYCEELLKEEWRAKRSGEDSRKTLHMLSDLQDLASSAKYLGVKRQQYRSRRMEIGEL